MKTHVAVTALDLLRGGRTHRRGNPSRRSSNDRGSGALSRILPLSSRTKKINLSRVNVGMESASARRISAVLGTSWKVWATWTVGKVLRELWRSDRGVASAFHRWVRINLER